MPDVEVLVIGYLTEGDGRRYVDLVARWDHMCIICGRSFQNIACVSREHIIPKSFGGKGSENIAPSHWSCNSFRGTMSLLDAQRAVERQLRRLGPHNAQEWLSRPVPGRMVFEWARMPILDATWFLLTGEPILSAYAKPANACVP